MKIERLAENEDEFSTDVVLQIGSKYILRHENGGTRGSFQNGNQNSSNHGFLPLVSEDEPLTAEEAAAKCLEFGASDEVIEAIE